MHSPVLLCAQAMLVTFSALPCLMYLLESEKVVTIVPAIKKEERKLKLSGFDCIASKCQGEAIIQLCTFPCALTFHYPSLFTVIQPKGRDR